MKVERSMTVLRKMIGTSVEHILEHFKESLSPKVEYPVIEIEDLGVAIGRAQVLVLLFKLE